MEIWVLVDADWRRQILSRNKQQSDGPLFCARLLDLEPYIIQLMAVIGTERGVGS